MGWVGEWVSGESMSNLFKWRISGKVNIYNILYIVWKSVNRTCIDDGDDFFPCFLNGF